MLGFVQLCLQCQWAKVKSNSWDPEGSHSASWSCEAGTAGTEKRIWASYLESWRSKEGFWGQNITQHQPLPGQTSTWQSQCVAGWTGATLGVRMESTLSTGLGEPGDGLLGYKSKSRVGIRLFLSVVLLVLILLWFLLEFSEAFQFTWNCAKVNWEKPFFCICEIIKKAEVHSRIPAWKKKSWVNWEKNKQEETWWGA